MQFIIRLGAILLTTLVFINTCFAAMPGTYLGMGFGYSQLEDFIDAKKIRGGTNVGGKIFAGYNFNKYFGLEASYAKYAKTTFKDDGYGVLFNYNLQVISLVVKGYTTDENSPFNLYALFGLAKAYGKIDFPDRNITSFSSSPFTTIAGFGGSYDINSHTVISLELSRIRGVEGNSTHISIPFSNLITLNLAYQI